MRSFPWRDPSGERRRVTGQGRRRIHAVRPGGLREQQRASPPRPPRLRPAAAPATKPGSASRRPLVDVESSRRAVSVHTEYTSRPPGRTSVAAAARSSRCSAASSSTACGLDAPARFRPAAQDPEAGARRVDAAPGRSSRSRNGSARPSAATESTTCELEPRRGALRRVRAGPRATSTATTSPRSSIASASAVTLPPGAAPISSTRSPGWAPTAAATAWLPWSCGVARPSATAASRPGSPPPPTMSASGSRPPRSTLAPAALELRFDRLGGDLPAGSPATSARPARSPAPARPGRRPAPRSAKSRATIQSGIEVRIPTERASSPVGERPRRPDLREPAQDRVDVPLGPRRRPAPTAPTVSPTAACGGDAVDELVDTEPQRGPHRRVEIVEVAVEQRLEQRVEGSAPSQRPVDQVGRLRPLARLQPGGCAGASGSSTLAKAPSSTRTSTSRATIAAASAVGHTNDDRTAVTGAPRGERHRLLPLGLHLVGHEAAGPLRIGVHVAAPDLEALAVHVDPGAGPRVPRPHDAGASSSAGAAGSSSNSSTVSFSAYVGSPVWGVGLGRRDRRAACAAGGRCRASTSRACSSPAVSVGVDRGRARDRRPDRCRGRLRAP